MAPTRALLRLALGGTFFGRYVPAAGPKRLDYRMNISLTGDTEPRIAVVSNVAEQGGIGTSLALRRGSSVSDTISDRGNAVAGIIPDGSQGIRLQAAQQEWMMGTVPSGVLAGDGLAIAWYGIVHALPSVSESVVPLVYLRAGPAGGDHRFGIAITDTGQLWSIYNDSFGDIAGALPVVGEPVLLGLTKDTNDPTTLRLYANGQLLATSGPLAHVPTNAFTLVVATNHSDIIPLFGPFLDSTHYFLGIA